MGQLFGHIALYCHIACGISVPHVIRLLCINKILNLMSQEKMQTYIYQSRLMSSCLCVNFRVNISNIEVTKFFIVTEVLNGNYNMKNWWRCILLRLNKTVLFPKVVPLCILPLVWSPGPCFPYGPVKWLVKYSSVAGVSGFAKSHFYRN